MGRPETKRWVSPATTTLLCLVLMQQGHVLASTIFPLNSNSQIGTPQDSSSSWDFDDGDIETSDGGEYANFFSEDNISSSEENAASTSASNPHTDWKDETNFYNSLESNSNSFSGIPGKSRDTTKVSYLLPHYQRTRPLALATLTHLTKSSTTSHHHNSRTTSATMSHLDVNQSRFGNGKMKIDSLSYSTNNPSTPSPHIHNNGHNGRVDDFGTKNPNGYSEKARRFFSSNNRKNGNTTDSKQSEATTMDTFSVDSLPLLSNEATKNQSEHGKKYSSLQFKFPYRIPFPYVRRENNEDEDKKAGIQPQNINEESRSTRPSQSYATRDMRLQRRNRSKRNTLQNDTGKEIKRVITELEESNVENQELYQSSNSPSGSVLDDEVAEEYLRHNTTRPPPPSNPVEALQRLTRMLDKMLRELSLFGQKFTLRLIRMTERQDIDQMQDIMKDFDISPGKPIFFIAGGLRKLNESVVTRVVPLSTAATVNLTESTTVATNETVLEPTTELPVVNSSEDVTVPFLREIDYSTVVSILRPTDDEIASLLPVASETSNDESEPTTETPHSESETVIPSQNISEPSIPSVTIIPSPPSPPLARRRRAIPEVNEFYFLPIPGRSARTENPYDDEEEFYPYNNNYAQASESVDEMAYDETLAHLASAENVDISKSNIVSPNRIPAEIGMIDQSQSQRNDEISSNEYNAIIGHSGGGSGKRTPALLITQEVASSSSSDLSDPSLRIALSSTDSSVVPPSGSIKTESEKVVEKNEGSNDHRQGEQNHVHEIQTKNADVSTVDENNIIRHVEEYLPIEKHLKSQVVKDDDNILYNSPSASTDQISSQIPNLERRKPISSFVDESQKADKRLNLVHETSAQEQSRVAQDVENKLEISKAHSSSPLLVPLENADGSLELLYDRKPNGNSHVVTPALVPGEFLLVEERSFQPTAVVDRDKQNVAQKLPLHDIILIKDGRVESGNQQLLNPQLNTEVDRDVSFSSLKNGVVSENEGIVIGPPTHTTPAVEPILVTGIASPVSRVPILNEAVIVPNVAEREDSHLLNLSSPSSIGGLGSSVVLDDINVNMDLEAPHRVVLISKPQESNHNDPQVEIKAESPLPQNEVLLPDSGINIPLAGEAIREILPTPYAEKMPITLLKQVPVPHIQQRTISSKPTTSLNSIVLEDTLPILPGQDPMRVPSNVAPTLFQTEDSSSLVASTSPVGSPSEIILDREGGNEEETRNKQQQSFTVGENQASLVGKQSGDIMKKVVVGKEGEEIEREKAQVSPDQPTFHTPAVLKEIQIIGNNNATFLPADKASPPVPNNEMPIHAPEHVVVRGAEIVDRPGTTLVQGETTVSNIDEAVRNSGAVPQQNSKNSDVSTVEEIGHGSIVAPIVSDNGEVRNPIETGILPVTAAGKENVDVLSENFPRVNLAERIISHEPLNVGSIVLSPNEVTIPLKKDVRTVSEDRLNVGSLLENAPLDVPALVPDSSTDVYHQAEKISTQDATPFLIHNVREPEIRNIEKVKAVIDLPKTVRDVIKPEIIKVEPIPEVVPNSDTSAIVPVDKKVESVAAVPVIVPPHVSEVVKVAPVEVVTDSLEKATTGAVTPGSQVSPVVIPADTVIKVVPEESKVADVANAISVVDNLKINPVNIPVKESIVVGSEGIATSDSHRPSEEEVHKPEVVKVDSLLPIKVDDNTLQVPTPEILPPPPTIVTKGGSMNGIVPSTPTVSTVELSDPVLPYSSTVPIIKPMKETVKPEPLSIVPDLLVAPVLKPGHEVILSSPVEQILKNTQEIVESIPILKQTLGVVQSSPLVDMVTQPGIVVGKAPVEPATVHIPSNVPLISGDDSIIASLPQVDPDSAFGIKPIDTQPHYQIPGLRPPVQERPHPDYIQFLSQGMDMDSVIFGPPTRPVLISSPPVFSGYSPSEILRKQEQMKKTYGLYLRRALPI